MAILFILSLFQSRVVVARPSVLNDGRMLLSVKLNNHLLTELEGVAVADVKFILHGVEALTALIPGAPVVVAGSAERMVGVAAALAHSDTATAYGFLASDAHMGLLAAVRSLLARDQPEQWALGAAVGLVHRHLGSYEWLAWHFIFF